MIKTLSVRLWIFGALLLSLAFTGQWTIKAEFWNIYYSEEPTDSLSELFLDKIPRQARDLAADYFWLTADEYMHFGSSKKVRERFLAGSYAGNTEILPLIELAIFLDPQHIDAYGILSQNLAMYLNRYIEGIRLLQRGILTNKHSPRLHELYGNVAYCYAFIESYNNEGRKNDRAVALRYLNEAIKAYEKWDSIGKTPPKDPVMNPTTYQILRSRFLVEAGQQNDALTAWNKSGLELQSSNDLLAKYLRKVEKGEPVPRLPEDLVGSQAERAPEPAPVQGMANPPLGATPHGHEPAGREKKQGDEQGDAHTHDDKCGHQTTGESFNQVFRKMMTQIGVFSLLICVLHYRKREEKKA